MTETFLRDSISPSQVTIESPGGVPAVDNFQITVANNNPDGTTVTINSIKIIIPTGATNASLTPPDDVSAITAKAPDGWTLTGPTAGSDFAFWLLEPGTASGQLADGAELVLPLVNMTITNAVGSAQIWAYETIDGGAGQSGTPSNLVVGKVAPTAAITSFAPVNPIVQLGQQPVLTWTSQGLGQCTLQPTNPIDAAPITVPANSPTGGYKAPAVTSTGTATYYLYAQINGESQPQISQKLFVDVTRWRLGCRAGAGVGRGWR